jgi:hypothetical protein
MVFTCNAARKSLKLSPKMNIKRLILAIVVAFVVLWVTDCLIHGLWMKPDYRATQSLWRPETEMGSYMGWMLCAQLLFVITLVLVWAKGFARSTTKISCAIGYGLLMGLFSESGRSSCTLLYRCRVRSRRNGSSPVSCKPFYSPWSLSGFTSRRCPRPRHNLSG